MELFFIVCQKRIFMPEKIRNVSAHLIAFIVFYRLYGRKDEDNEYLRICSGVMYRSE